MAAKLRRVIDLERAEEAVHIALLADPARGAMRKESAVSSALDRLDELSAPAPDGEVARIAGGSERTVVFRFAWEDPKIPVTLHLYVDGKPLTNRTYHGGGVEYFQGPTSLEPGQKLRLTFGATFWHGGWRYHLDMRRISGEVVALGAGKDPDPTRAKDDVVTITSDTLEA